VRANRASPSKRSGASQALRFARALAAGFALAALASSALAAIGVNKTFNPTNVSAGQTSTLSVILINNNPAAATGATFSDNFPASVVVASPLSTSTSCGGAVTAVVGATNFSFSGGTIPAAAGGVAGQCTVTVNVVSPTPGVYINTIPAGAVTSSQGSSAQAAQATLTVAALRHITGTKVFAPANLHGNGNPSTVTITLANPNGVQLTNATFNDALPAGLAIAPTPNSSTTCVGGTVTANAGATSASFTGGTIPANGSCTVKFDVVASAPNTPANGNVTNTIGAGTVTTNEGVINDAISGAVRLQTAASITKAFAPTPITTGGTSTLTITINNFNAATLSPISFTDTLPATASGSIVIAPVPNATTTCGNVPPGTLTTGANSITIANATLAGVAANAGITNTSCTITVNAVGNSTSANPNTLTNTIPAGNFGGVNYAAASGNLVINAPTNVSGSKAFVPNAVVQGGTSTLTVTLNNAAATPATLTSVFTDSLATMGAGYTIAAAPPATMTCGGTLTATPGATSFSIAVGGTIPAAGACTITVPVQVASNAVTGARTNTIAQGALVTNQGRTQSAITATLTTTAALTVAKAFAPATVAAGADSRLTVTLTHANGAPAFSGMAFTDTLPAGHVVSTTPNVASTCGGAVTANPGAGSFSLAGGALAAGATSCTISVNITTPAGAGSGTNTIAAGAVTTTEGFVNAAAASATVTRVVTSVVLNKSFNPATVLVGGVSTLTINVLNTTANALALTTTALADNLPLGMVIAAPPTATNTCGGVLTAVAGASSLSLANGSIGANATCQITVHVVANSSGNLIDTLPAGAFISAQGVTNPLAASATLSATGTADLTITKTDGVVSVTPGLTTTYTIVVGNLGPNDVAGATITDTPPANMTFTSWTCAASAGAACGAASGSGPINETISVNKSATVTYTVTALIASGATGTITNTATITPPGTVIDTNPANNTASDTDTLVPVASIAVNKTDGSLTYTPGAGATYTIVVTNGGPSDATSVVVNDSLPAGVTLSSNATCVTAGTANCGTVTGTTGQTTFGTTGASIKAGAGNSLTFTVPVKFASSMIAATITNTVNVTANASPPASASDTDTRAPISSLSITKTDSSPTYTPGGSATYTIVVKNGGPTDALAVSVNDPLPAGVTLTGTVTCVAAGAATCGTVTGTAGQTTFGTTAATIPAGAANSLTFSAPVAYASSLTTNPLVNTVTATDPASPTATASDSDNLATQVVLSVTKDDGSTTYTPGGTAIYTVTVKDTGVSDATNVTVTDALPAGVTLSGSATCAATGSANCGTVTGTVGQTSFGTTGAQITAGAGNALTFTVPVKFAAGMVTNPLVNTATATDVPSGATASGSDSDTRAPQVTLAVNKTDGSMTYTPGGTATYTVTVVDNGVTDALSVNVSDALPPGVTLTGTVTCVATGTANCGTVSGSAGQTSFSTTGASIAAGGGNSIEFTVPVAFASGLTTDPLINTATATDVPSGATGSGSDSDTRAPAVTLVVTKTDGSPTYTPGGSATYTITIKDTGSTDALNVTIADALPPGVTLNGTVTCVATGTASCGTVSGTAGQTNFGATNATIAAGGANMLTFAAPVAFSASLTDNPLINTATATDIPSGASGSGSDSDNLLAQSNLTLSKTDGSPTYTPGGGATYVIVAGNSGASDAMNVTVSDALPAGVTLTGTVTCTPAGVASCGTVSGTAGQTTFGTTGAKIPAGGGNTLTFTAPVAFASNLTTNPLVNAVTATDPTSPPASASDSDNLAAFADLAIVKDDGVTIAVPGGSVVYTIVASNLGPSDVTNALVADVLPAIVNGTWTCVGAGGGTCPASGVGNINALVNLPVGGTATFSLTAQISPAAIGTLSNMATISPPGGVTDPNPGNNASTDIDTLVPSAILGINKTDGSLTYTPGGSATYTVTVTNAGPSNATNVNVNDPLPVGVTLTGTATCVASGGAVCGAVFGTAGQTAFGTANATIFAGGGSTLTFTAPVAFASSLNTDPLVNTVTAASPASPPASAQDSDTRAATASLVVTKTDGSLTYTPGGSATYTIMVTNGGPSDTINTAVNDALPAGVVLSGSATCVVAGVANCGTVTGSAGQTTFGTTGASIKAGAGNSLTFSAPVNFASSLTTDPLVNTATATDPSSPPASGTDSDNRAAQVTLAVTKDDGSATYTPGGTATYIVTVKDTGLSDATNVNVADALPAGVTLTAAVTCAASGAATCGTVTGAAGQTSFSATGASVGVGPGDALTFTVPVAFAAGLATNPLINTATATDVPTGATASGSDSDARSSAVSLAVVKTDGSATYMPGGTATYSVTIINGGISDALNVNVADPLPPGVTLTANVTCVANGTATCGAVTGSTGQTSFTVTGATIGAGAGNSLVISVPVAFAAGLTTDPLVNTATATDLASGATGQGSDSDNRAAQVSLVLTKTDNSATYTPGGTATYAITVANTGVSDALTVTVNDALPPGVTLTGTVNCAPTGAATCGAVTGTAGQTTFGTTGATINGGGNLLTFTAPVAFAPNMIDNPLINTVTASDASSGASGSASDSDTRSAQAAIAVTKTDNSVTYTPGSTGTYVITVTNAGPTDALDLAMNDPLPAGVTLTATATCVATGTATCGTVTGLTAQATFGTTAATLAAGAGNSLTFTAPVAFASSLVTDPLVNTVTVTDPATAPVTASDSDARFVDVKLGVTKSDGSPTYVPGGTATYVVTVTNTGATNALNVTVTDAFPAGVTLTGTVTCVAGGGANCGAVTGAAGQTSFSATNAVIPGGGAATLAFSVPVAFSASLVTDPLVNTATATDGPSGSTASGSDSNTRSTSVALAVTKTDNSATYTPGGTATYVVVVSNGGLTDATSVTVTDPLPAGVTLSASATCVASGTSLCGAVTGAAGGTSFGTSGARVSAGGGNALTFTVPVAFASSMTTSPLVNTATATDVATGATASGSDSDLISGAGNLAVTKTDNSATYTPGGTATYVVTVTNGGPSDAMSITVNDPLPAGVTLSGNVLCAATGAAACGTVTGTTGQTTFGTTGAKIPVGAGNSLTFTAPVAFAPSMTTNPLVNTVTVSDPSSPTRSASDTDTLGAAADVSITKTGPATVAPGGQITWRLTIANAGPSSANGATFSDALPAAVSSISASCGSPSGGAACGAIGVVGQLVSGSVAMLPPGGAVVITILATAPATNGTLVNTANVVPPPGITDPNPANQTSTASAIVQGSSATSIPIPVDATWMLTLLAMLVVGAGMHRIRYR